MNNGRRGAARCAPLGEASLAPTGRLGMSGEDGRLLSPLSEAKGLPRAAEMLRSAQHERVALAARSRPAEENVGATFRSPELPWRPEGLPYILESVAEEPPCG